MFRASLLTLLGALLLISADTPQKSAFDKPTLEAYIRHLFLIQPAVTVTPGDPAPCDLPGFKQVKVRLAQGPNFQDVTLYVSNDGKKIVQGNVYDVANNPFKPDLDKLHTQFQPNLGTAGAPVAIVVFSDLQCPHCKGEAEMLRKNLIQNYPKEVRLYFKDFPIESLHPWAKAAAIAGRCIFSQSNDAFWAYHDWAFAHQDSITPATLKDQVLEWAKEQKGLDVAKLGACIEKKTSEPEVDAEMKEARDLEITGTPTMFINGRRIGQSIDWPNLKNIIDTEIEYQKVAKNAGDDCGCEVQLPVPALGKPAGAGLPKKK
ncbi:MAG TPA: DsbA family protein [Candidatus Acidoferrales bacterium]|nr:DsbA family protein [Candidatus Acidoferrales bacterium]